jgi:hypothetical protein
MHRRALEGSEKVLGREHPSTLTSVNNLGFGECGTMFVSKHLLSCFQRPSMHRFRLFVFPLPRDTLTSVNNLGLVLDRQGKYEESEAMHRRALEGSEIPTLHISLACQALSQGY